MIRALLNIFSNAADFTPQDGRVEFRTAVKEGTLQFMVSDSGPGFSAKAIAGAAQRFYMEDESRTQSMHYGMGLYIADTIVKKHGGKLKIRNSLKLKGAEVTVSIPGPYY